MTVISTYVVQYAGVYSPATVGQSQWLLGSASASWICVRESTDEG
jgi:hypothetical protein